MMIIGFVGLGFVFRGSKDRRMVFLTNLSAARRFQAYQPTQWPW
jgi:hypothetical protein